MTFRSSVTLQRIGDEPRGPRRLRLRADHRLSERLGPPEAADEVARMTLPCRETVENGERIYVEISFGAMVDEIEVEGRVASVVPSASGAPPTIVIVFDHRHRAQIAYVQGVLGGLRSPSARAHRRVPVDMTVHWRCGELRQQTRALDLSRGGAFILSHLQPMVGAAVEVEFEGDGTSPILRLAASVSWIQRMGGGPTAAGGAGFGVRFQIRSREEADHLQRMVRAFAAKNTDITDR